MSKRRHILPSAPWVNGGNIQIPVKDLPPLQKVRAFVFRLEGVFTTGAAAAAVASTQLHRLISMLTIGPNHRGSGQYWHDLEWQVRGGETCLPAGLPAANNEVHQRVITWVVPFRDRRAAGPADGQPFGIDFGLDVISIDTAQFAGLGAGTWDTLASITGTLRVEAILDPANDSPGSLIEHGFADLTGQAPTLGPGLYTDVFLYRENAATISSVQVATIQAQVDGLAYHDAVRLSEYARAYNDAYALGTDLQTASATVPAAGERIPDEPAFTAGAAATVTVPFLPIVFPDPGFKLTKCLKVEQSLRFDFTGTDTTFRVGYRRIKGRSPAEMVQAFQRIGRTDVKSLADIAPKCLSKRSLAKSKAAWGRFMPLRAVRSR